MAFYIDKEEKNNMLKEKEEIFIGIDEASKILGIHRNTLQRWCQKDWKNKSSGNKIILNNFLCPPYIRIGSRYKFKREDVKNFIKNQTNYQ